MTPWWAGQSILVTGASSGIGWELARGFACDASALVLVARRLDRLEELAQELRSAHPTLAVHLVPADLSRQEERSRVVAEVREAVGELDVLVNNAGVGDQAAFTDAQWDRLERVVDVNVLAPLHLTHEFLGSMVARGRGGVLTMGSGAGHVAIKEAATYSASKHFIDGLMESLRMELVGTGVVATQVCPGPVPTEFDVAAGAADGLKGLPPVFEVSAERCAEDALAGFARRQAIVYPGRPYRALMGLLPLVPRAVLRRGAR